MLWLSKLGLKVKPRFLTAPFWAQILQRPPLDYPWWGLPASCWVLPWVLQIIISSDGDTKCLRDEGALKCMFRYQIFESMFSTQRSLHPRWKTCSGRCPAAWKWRFGAGLGNHWVHPQPELYSRNWKQYLHGLFLTSKAGRSTASHWEPCLLFSQSLL